ncbi:hypothetical protein [Nocardia gipuzkoensis]|uniref:hypothetical protein n=1 Tax=Nocardia gipuzkoensis TaxID=2749991 RepID=UPI0015EFA1EE|nr:hypothetical protein [Nocardia gipuzkoensis]
MSILVLSSSVCIRPKRLHRCIVEAITDSPERRQKPLPPEVFTERPRRESRAVIGMHDQPLGGVRSVIAMLTALLTNNVSAMVENARPTICLLNPAQRSNRPSRRARHVR